MAERNPEARDGKDEVPPSTGLERALAERQAVEGALQVQSEFWRQEVANRVEGYRIRRSRKRLAGQFSMRLDFESSRPVAPSEATAPAPEALSPVRLNRGTEGAPQLPVEVNEANNGREALMAATFEPLLASLPRKMETQLPLEPAGKRGFVVVQETKIIEFPRSLIFPDFEPDPNALAETIFDKPRILDVPEAVGAPPPPLADIALLPDDQEEEHAAPPELELPMQVAPIPQRFTAALVNLLLIIVATAMFGMVISYLGVGLSYTKPLLAFGMAVPLFFWGVYHYLFLVHAGTTPGMAMARIRMCRFEDGRVPRSLRRWRALLMVLSAVSLGFGFLWALFDQDSLCWHDKMTRTYLTMEV